MDGDGHLSADLEPSFAVQAYAVFVEIVAGTDNLSFLTACVREPQLDRAWEWPALNFSAFGLVSTLCGDASLNFHEFLDGVLVQSDEFLVGHTQRHRSPHFTRDEERADDPAPMEFTIQIGIWR